jgi:integrase/recombinase XerD
MEAINIYPELQKHRVNSQGLAPIIIRFDFKRKHLGTESLGDKIKPEHWDQYTKKVKQKSPNAELINLKIDNKINRHKNFILKRQAFGLSITTEILKQYLKSNSSYESFYSYAETVIDKKKLKDGQGYTEDSKRRYRDEIKRLMQYKPELQFHQITNAWLEDYRVWLTNAYKKKDGKKLEKNSIWKALGFIRMIYNEAIKDEIILSEGNPFKQFKVGGYEINTSKVKFLEKFELEALERTLTTRSDLSEVAIKVGWRFLFMCVSGMRISDAMRLDDYYFTEEGTLQFKPHKTLRHGNTATVPMSTDRQKRYLRITLQHQFKSVDPKSFRSTFNNHLKILAAMSGISINLTSHVGRHTMGGFIVDAGIEDKPAMAMLGIKSTKVIKTYLHLKNDKLLSEGVKLNNVF